VIDGIEQLPSAVMTFDPKHPETVNPPLTESELQTLFYPEQQWESAFRVSSEHARMQNIQPDVGTEVAAVLTFLSPMFKARRALDLGTNLGFSARLLAETVDRDGYVISIESDRRRFEHAKEALAQDPLGSQVEIRNENAFAFLAACSDTFDLILLDISKDQYSTVLDACVARLASGGYLLVDDIRFAARKFEPENRDLSFLMTNFVKKLLEREDLETIYLPLGDGISISRKLVEQ
jgi:predicted O-methyltransferase YrrM